MKKEKRNPGYGLTDVLLKSYLAYPDICGSRRYGSVDLAACIEILDEIRQLLFPGFFQQQEQAFMTKAHLSAAIDRIRERLSGQIASALLYDGWSPASQKADKEPDQYSRQLTDEFFMAVPDIRSMIHSDIEAAYEGDPAAFHKDEIILTYPGIYAVAVNRIAHLLYQRNVPLIPRIWSEHAHRVTGIDIHPGAQIGSHFFIDHGNGVVIGETTVIGDHVKIYQGVTLGAISTRGGHRLKNMKRHPTLENYVTVYSGASILGGDTVIGDHVVIGSNAFVTQSVQSCKRVSVRPPKLEFLDRPARQNGQVGG